MSDPLHNRIMELLAFNAEAKAGEKILLANNMCYILRDKYEDAKIDLLALNVILTRTMNPYMHHKLKLMLHDTVIVQSEREGSRVEAWDWFKSAAEGRVGELSR